MTLWNIAIRPALKIYYWQIRKFILHLSMARWLSQKKDVKMKNKSYLNTKNCQSIKWYSMIFSYTDYSDRLKQEVALKKKVQESYANVCNNWGSVCLKWSHFRFRLSLFIIEVILLLILCFLFCCFF